MESNQKSKLIEILIIIRMMISEIIIIWGNGQCDKSNFILYDLEELKQQRTHLNWKHRRVRKKKSVILFFLLNEINNCANE